MKALLILCSLFLGFAALGSPVPFLMVPCWGFGAWLISRPGPDGIDSLFALLLGGGVAAAVVAAVVWMWRQVQALFGG